MGKNSLAPGVRFHPTDVELVMYYLKRKVLGKKHAFKAIAEVDIYKHAPWDLPDMSCLKTRDLKWFFYCPIEKKYARGASVNRATVYGYWKTTGKDRPVQYNEEVVGMIKSLVFHRGKAPRGERTDWVMHEYRLVEKKLADRGIVQDAYVLCAVFKKDGVGPKNGAQYGAPFKEEDWSDDEDANLLGTGPSDDSSGLYTQPLVLDTSATVIDIAGIVNHGYAAPTGSVDEDANLPVTYCLSSMSTLAVGGASSSCVLESQNPGLSDESNGLSTLPQVVHADATVSNHGYAAPTGSVDEDANLPVTYSLSSMSTLAVGGASSSCVLESQNPELFVESNGLSTLPQVVHADATVSNHGYAPPTGSVDEDANLPVTYSLSSVSTLAVGGASSSCVLESQNPGPSVESNGLSTLPQVVHADATVSNHGYAAPTGSVDEDANLLVTDSLSSMSTLAVGGASSSCVPESQSLGLSVESNGLYSLPQVGHADATVSITADIHSSNYAAYTCVGAPQVPVVADGKAVPVLLEVPQFALAPEVEESNGSILSMLDLFTAEDAFTTYDRGQMTGNADDAFCLAPQVSDDDDILSLLAYFD